MWPLCLGVTITSVFSVGEPTKKRKRGRPPKSETLARQKAEREAAEERRAAEMKAAQPQKAEEEEDEVVDAGAIDDPAGQERKKKTISP